MSLPWPGSHGGDFPFSAVDPGSSIAFAGSPRAPDPFRNPSQATQPDVPIVSFSRTTCVVRVGCGVSGDARISLAPDQGGCSAGGRLRPATTGRAGACHAKGISGDDRGPRGRGGGGLGTAAGSIGRGAGRISRAGGHRPDCTDTADRRPVAVRGFPGQCNPR
jgi:hypothetical protein